MDTAQVSQPVASTYPIDKTVEEALLAVSRAFHSQRTAADVRTALDQGQEIEFRIVVRRHHDGIGFCLAFDRFTRAAAKHVFWRTNLT